MKPRNGDLKIPSAAAATDSFHSRPTRIAFQDQHVVVVEVVVRGEQHRVARPRRFSRPRTGRR